VGGQASARRWAMPRRAGREPTSAPRYAAPRRAALRRCSATAPRDSRSCIQTRCHAAHLRSRPLHIHWREAHTGSVHTSMDAQRTCLPIVTVGADVVCSVSAGRGGDVGTPDHAAYRNLRPQQKQAHHAGRRHLARPVQRRARNRRGASPLLSAGSSVEARVHL
jgi:hypothetical protein